jgi:hypothetical protein
MKLWFRSFLWNKGEELCACLYFCINNGFGVVYFSYTVLHTIYDIGLLRSLEKYIYFHIKKFTAASTCFTRFKNGILGQLKYIKKIFGVQFCNDWQFTVTSSCFSFLSTFSNFLSIFQFLYVYFLISFLSTFLILLVVFLTFSSCFIFLFSKICVHMLDLLYIAYEVYFVHLCILYSE